MNGGFSTLLVQLWGTTQKHGHMYHTSYTRGKTPLRVVPSAFFIYDVNLGATCTHFKSDTGANKRGENQPKGYKPRNGRSGAHVLFGILLCTKP